MKLTEREIRWIESNADLIETYPENIDELIRQLIDYFSFETKELERLLILIHYTKYGKSGFLLMDDTNSLTENIFNVKLVAKLNPSFEFFSFVVYRISPGEKVFDIPEVRVRGLLHVYLQKESNLPENICLDISSSVKFDEDLFLTGKVIPEDDQNDPNF